MSYGILLVFILFTYLSLPCNTIKANAEEDEIEISIIYRENNPDSEPYDLIKNDFTIIVSFNGEYKTYDYNYPKKLTFKKDVKDLTITILTNNQNLYVRNPFLDKPDCDISNGVVAIPFNAYLRTEVNGKKIQLTRKYKPKGARYNLEFFLSYNPSPNKTSYDGTVDQSGGHSSSSSGGDFTSNAVVGSRPDNTSTTLWTDILKGVKEFRGLINLITNIILAIAILTSILITIINVVKFSTSSSHPVLRREASINLLTCAICIALLAATKYISVLIIDLAM